MLTYQIIEMFDVIFDIPTAVRRMELGHGLEMLRSHFIHLIDAYRICLQHRRQNSASILITKGMDIFYFRLSLNL